jgi:rhodanese-related sulfurtransferase
VIEPMLVKARARIRRYAPDEIDEDVLLVDLRSNDERARDGIIPGSVHVPRSVLEWRCDPDSGYSNPVLAGRRLVLVCAHGESSSLAAASLVEFGLDDAGDLVGGFEAWRDAGLPVVAAPEPEGMPGMGGRQ